MLTFYLLLFFMQFSTMFCHIRSFIRFTSFKLLDPQSLKTDFLLLALCLSLQLFQKNALLIQVHKVRTQVARITSWRPIRCLIWLTTTTLGSTPNCHACDVREHMHAAGIVFFKYMHELGSGHIYESMQWRHPLGPAQRASTRKTPCRRTRRKVATIGRSHVDTAS